MDGSRLQRDCHRLPEILHILDHKFKLFLSFLLQSCSSLTFTDRAGSLRFLFCVPNFGMIRSKIGSKMIQSLTKFSSAICVLFMFGCWVYKDSSAWWCYDYDWLEPSITESIVTAGKWLLKASWNFKMRKSSRINASEHHIIKQKQRSCQSHVMTHDQNLDSNFWVILSHTHETHWEKSCETSAVWFDFRHVDIGMTAQEGFR